MQIGRVTLVALLCMGPSAAQNSRTESRALLFQAAARNNQAVQLASEGREGEAEQLYRDLLKDQPAAVFAIEGLGVVLYQQGRAKEAAAVFARGVEIEPWSVRFHANLGEALRATRRGHCSSSVSGRNRGPRLR